MKEKIGQLELFSPGEETNVSRTTARNRTFFYWISGYERFIFTVISIIIISTITFCLGIEKGKRTITKDAQLQKTITDKNPGVNIQTLPAIQKQKQQIPKHNEGNVVFSRKDKSDATEKPIDKKIATKSLNKGYTIQVGSFKQKSNAQKTVTSLKNKGYNAFIISKGQYLIICIGGFSDKQSALKSLDELRKSYQDCLLRKI